MSDPIDSMVATPPAEQPTMAGSTAPVTTGLAASEKQQKPRGLLGDAWYDLRRKPMFWISASLIALFLVMAAFPFLFTSSSPTDGLLARSRVGPAADGWFGYDVQG